MINTKQKPIQSGFDETTSAEEVIQNINLKNKIAIVTGSSSGIGLETARVLSNAGATVLALVRDYQKASQALKGIPNMELYAIDLSDPHSIDIFIGEFLKSNRPLDILINNAGIMGIPLKRDGRGYELQFSTNHLGHFQLTTGLWPALKKAGGARVVTLASRAHRLGGVDFDDPMFEHKGYDKWKAYAQSKTANILFSVALDQRGRKYKVRAFAANPGAVNATGLSRDLSEAEKGPKPMVDKNGNPIKMEKDFEKTIEQGAATSVWCAVSEQLNGMGGLYCEDVNIAKQVPGDSTLNTGVRPWAIDSAAAGKLWKMSVELTGANLQ